jgi:hypothetical protein
MPGARRSTGRNLVDGAVFHDDQEILRSILDQFYVRNRIADDERQVRRRRRRMATARLPSSRGKPRDARYAPESIKLSQLVLAIPLRSGSPMSAI